MKVKIRKMREADIDSIFPIWLSMHQDHLGYDQKYYKLRSRRALLNLTRKYWIHNFSDPKAYCVVAEGKVVGAAICNLVKAPPVYEHALRRRADLTIFVDKASQGTGVGKMLMSSIEEWARKKGAAYLELRVDTRNSRAKRFYRDLGFGNRQTVMIKELNSG